MCTMFTILVLHVIGITFANKHLKQSTAEADLFSKYLVLNQSTEQIKILTWWNHSIKSYHNSSWEGHECLYQNSW